VFAKIFQLLWVFTKVGVLGYGGGPALIPLVQVEVVDNYKWLDMGEFADVLAMGYALPGPIATKMSAVVGYRVAGGWGAFAAILGMIVPTIILVLALSTILTSFKGNVKVTNMINAIRAVVIGMLSVVVIDMFPKAILANGGIFPWIIAIITIILLLFTKVHPAFMIIAAGAFGYFMF